MEVDPLPLHQEDLQDLTAIQVTPTRLRGLPGLQLPKEDRLDTLDTLDTLAIPALQDRLGFPPAGPVQVPLLALHRLEGLHRDSQGP